MTERLQSYIMLCFLGAGVLWSPTSQAQVHEADTSKRMDEVTIQSQAKKKIETELKMAVTVDEFLASSQQISFIKRGAYAWEPLLNNMSTERSVITIDGMHIFGACTDKMDPVTSYVESNNLASIDISSGQQGSMHGATVAGSIDLRRKATPFGLERTWSGQLQSGFEANNGQQFHLGNLSYSSERFVADASMAFRQAGNYQAGNGDEVLHSQFTKFNTSLGLAYKISELSSIRVDALFDQAQDVGYPALPMDLWLSRGLITSASYKRLFEQGALKVWDSKLYFNAMEHYMDDTKRPENLVHMDMPGWSNTWGLVSKAHLMKGQISSEVQLNLYQNQSIAEMTMYPQDRSNRTMFAYSWPWVSTHYAGVSMSNSWLISEQSQFNFGGSLGWNRHHSKYIEFNHIFYPEAPQTRSRILPALHATYMVTLGPLHISTGAGYGQRAPSVSEAYGYYIYNSFDRYDYVGNPNLDNETSYELNASLGYDTPTKGIHLQANHFWIQDYIVGRILSMGSPMNYQSVGVKGYTALEHARLFNLSLDAHYDLFTHLHWSGKVSYARATDEQGNNLPFIRPLSYESGLYWMHRNFGLRASVQGDLAQYHYSPRYGEDYSPAYQIWNLSADYSFNWQKSRAKIQLGVENLFDQHYSTYADWGNIPRMGRNLFTSITYSF